MAIEELELACERYYVPTTASYSLTYTGGDGATITIVQAAAFDSLKDDSMEPTGGEPQ